MQATVRNFLSEIQAGDEDHTSELGTDSQTETANSTVETEAVDDGATQTGDATSSEYTFSGVGLSGATAALRNFKSELSVPKVKDGIMTKASWKFEDLMDLPQDSWNNQFHELTSDWCDMVYPLISGVFQSKYNRPLGCSVDDVQHLLMVALFLHDGTEQPMRKCMRAFLSGALSLSIWNEGRRVNRPLWEMARRMAQEWDFQPVSSEGVNDNLSGLITLCLDQQEMEKILTKWDGSPEEIDKSAPKSVHTAQESRVCSAVGVFGASRDLVGISFWVSEKALGLNQTDKEGIQILGVFKSLAEALEHFRGTRSMLVGHPHLEHLWSDAGVYDLTGGRNGSDVAHTDGMTTHTGGPELWDLFQGQVYAESSANPGEDKAEGPEGGMKTPDGEAMMSGEETEMDTDCHSCPARMFAYVTNQKGRRTTGTLLARQLRRAQSLGAFTAIRLGGKTLSYYYDPGTSLTQMTPMEIARVGHVMELVSKGRVHYIFAESNTSKVVKLYKATGLQLLNPDTGATSKPLTTYVVENKDLKVYPRVLGRNTLADLGISVHHRSGTISDDTGNTWKLWDMLDKVTAEREEFERIQLTDDRRTLQDATQDYEANVLVDPPIPLSVQELFEIKQHAMSAGDDERHRHPDYVWSEENFMRAEQTNDRQYFIDATIADMPRVQRLLKRSDASFHNFSAYAGQWFLQSRPLQKLWALVWTQGTLGRPPSPNAANARKLKRLSHFESLGLCDPGFEQRVHEHQQTVRKSMNSVTTWQSEDDQLHIRVATAAGPMGVEPPTPTILPESSDSTSSSEEGVKSPQLTNNTSKTKFTRHPPITRASRYKVSMTDTQSPDTAALFDSPIQTGSAGVCNGPTGTPTLDTAALFDSPIPVKRNASVSASGRAVTRELFKPDGSHLSQKVRRIDVDTSTSSDDEKGEYNVSDEAELEGPRANEAAHKSMPAGSLDSEAISLLNPTGESTGKPMMKALVAKVRKAGQNQEVRKSSFLRQTVREAEDYGAYVPVLTNGVLSAWHYDSGAGISQFNLEAAKELAPFLERADWDEVDFVSARDVSVSE